MAEPGELKDYSTNAERRVGYPHAEAMLAITK